MRPTAEAAIAEAAPAEAATAAGVTGMFCFYFYS
jgi:hypothetical protein